MGKTILVTGANRGIGCGLAEQFLKSGAKVYAGHRPGSSREGMAALQKTHGDALVPLELEVDSEDSVANAADTLAEEGVTLDLLVNNAAVFPEAGNGPLSELDFWAMKEAFDINVVAPLRVTRYFLPALKLAGGGAAVAYISSGAGSISKSSGLYYAYGVSKAALNKAVRMLARDPEAEGVPQVLFTPGWVKTDMGGSNAELSLEDCVKPLAATLLALRPEQNGEFLDRFGKPSEYAW